MKYPLDTNEIKIYQTYNWKIDKLLNFLRQKGSKLEWYRYFVYYEKDLKLELTCLGWRYITHEVLCLRN